MAFPCGFRRPVLILPSDPDQLGDIQQIIQGVGAVPELMLLPEAQGDREEEKLIQVRAGGGVESDAAGREVDPPSPKKPVSVQSGTEGRSFLSQPCIMINIGSACFFCCPGIIF